MSDSNIGFATVPLRGRQHVRTILAFHDPRILAAAWPLAILLRVIVGTWFMWMSCIPFPGRNLKYLSFFGPKRAPKA